MDYTELIEAMSRPEFYPHRPSVIELVQTHISLIFLAGDLVYKVKKAVNFGFLDFSTLEQRREDCEKEIRLNRRFAPQFYLGVETICRQSGKLVLASDGEIVEYAVVMKRLPEEAMLSNVLQQGRADIEIMDSIAAKLAAFHAGAETGGEIDKLGGINTIRKNHAENFEQTKAYIGRTISREKYDFIKSWVDKFIAEKGYLLNERVSNHRIRDCHGDLHIEHICLADTIVFFDCIEFNDRFRYSDVAADVAFLKMDLDFKGYPQYGERFANAYIRLSGDPVVESMIPLYQCYYAYVRGKVIGFRIDDPSISQEGRAASQEIAKRYFDLALKYAARPVRPVMIITTGLMGTGKSVLARNVANIIDAVVIRTDVLRKELLDIRPEEKHLEEFGEGIYSEEFTKKTYQEALSRAATALTSGQSVIIDASYKDREERIRATQAAIQAGADFFVLECVCSESVVKERLTRRRGDSSEASDGRWELYASQKSQFDPVTEIEPKSHLVVDTCSDSRESALKSVRLIKQI